MGCPTSYDGKSATWSKGKLSRMTSGTPANGTDTYAFVYNAFGQRIGKTYSYLAGTSSAVQIGQLTGANKTYYYDHAGRLISETVSKTYNSAASSSESIVFLYDESSVIGMVHTVGSTANTYYFQRNLQGDIIAIVNENRETVARYRYDAWGRCLITSDTSNCNIATINPFRYRGYYYDEEIAMYYLQSRYYDPVIGRFINVDDISALGVGMEVLGYNLFSYCENDIVNNCDISGCLSWSSIASFFKKLLSGIKKVVDIVKDFISNQLSNYKAILGSWQDVSAIAKEIGRSPNKVKQSLNSIISKLQKIKARIGKIAIGITILSAIASLGEKIARLGNIAKIITEYVMETMKSVLEELLTKGLKAILKLIPTVGVILGLFANSIASAILDAVLKTARLQAAQQKIQIAIEATTYSLADYFIVFFKNLV